MNTDKENKDKQDKNLDNTFSITMELERPLFEDKVEEQPKQENPNIKRNILIGIVSILVMTFIIWISSAYKPLDLAISSLESDDRVEVSIGGDFISFTPQNAIPTKGLILYPGPKVQAEAYAPLARQIAENGYEVIIVNMPLNIAMLAPNKAQNVIDEYPNIKTWAIGGHSSGGTVASRFAVKNTDIDGVVLLASYPSGNELMTSGRDVISIWGSKDGVIDYTNLIESKDNLPANTTYVEIEGGNHSQFGDYGKQREDYEAIISQQEQLDITVSSIVEFLNEL